MAAWRVLRCSISTPEPNEARAACALRPSGGGSEHGPVRCGIIADPVDRIGQQMPHATREHFATVFAKYL